MNRIRVIAALALVALGLVVLPTPPVAAAPLGFTQMTENGQDLIYQIDLATGATSLVGDTGLPPATTALAFSADGTLYGVNGSDLITIDTTTGAATVVGSLTCCANARGLAFDANDDLWLVMGNPGTFHRVDTTTGAATAIGGMGPDFIGGLGATCDGVVALDDDEDQLLSVDVTTGATTEIGPLGANGYGGLSPDASGQLWLLGRPAAPGDSQTFTIDTTTGAATLVADSVDGNAPSSLAIAPLDCAEPPPSSTTTSSTPGTVPASTTTTAPAAPRPAQPVVTDPRFAG